MMALNEEEALTIKKSTMIETVRGGEPMNTDKVIIPIGWTISLEKPLSGIGPGKNLVASIPIRSNASQNKILTSCRC